MQKITIFQHLLQNAFRVIRKKGNNDVEFDAIGFSFFPLMANAGVCERLVEYYLFGNVHVKIPAFFFIGGILLIPLLLYFHTKDSRKAVKAYYKTLDPKRSKIYFAIFIIYYIGSIGLMFLIDNLIVSGKI
jgi:hypothetical protein